MRNEINRQGSVKLTWTDTSKALKILVLTKKPELMYEYLASKGDRYAPLANSVVKGDSFSGRFALNYFEEVIIENGHIYNEVKLEKIRFDMAYAYIHTLRNRLQNSVTEIIGDINYKEAMAFHERVFERYKLPAEAWTLQPVFNVIPDEKDREVYWQKALDAVGDTEKEAELSLSTMNIMFESLYDAPANKQLQTHRWMRRVIDIDNAVDSVTITLKKTYGFFESPSLEIGLNEARALVYETGNPLIDRGTNRLSFWDHPSENSDKYSTQTDWVGQTEFEHKNRLTEYYLERPAYILPETGLFNSPSVNYKPNIDKYNSMVDDVISRNPSAGYSNNHAPIEIISSGHRGFPVSVYRPNDFQIGESQMDRTVDNLRDHMSSMNHSSSSFSRDFSVPQVPSMPEFNYSGGYSSPSSRFSF
ncbi:serine protease [Providencia rustigianii]|uniref:serine protease n=1 Tax=Providencia rustigianii TaxID=158850 RepID=UPI002244C347|nr:serine protease [Providencia rustigianii]